MREPFGLSIQGDNWMLKGKSLYANNIIAPTPGKIYYVSVATGADTYLGTSWKKPYKTIAKAITMVNTGGFSNNLIIVAPGTYPESLTPPTVGCMILGVGSFGSVAQPLISPAAGDPVVGAVSKLALINLRFQSNAVNTNCLNLTTVQDMLVENCTFISNNATTGGNAIDVETSMYDSVIKGCYFTTLEAGTPFLKGIYITKAARNLIIGNIITGLKVNATARGIHIVASTGPAYLDNIIKDNIIYIGAAGEGITDADSMSLIIGNRIMTVAGTSMTAAAGSMIDNKWHNATACVTVFAET